MPPTRVKLIWFVPLSHLDATRDAVFTAGAGWIGDYARCSFWTVGTGSFYGTELDLGLREEAFPSPTLAGDHLFFSNAGGLTVVTTARPPYEVVARNTLEPFHASPAFVGLRLHWQAACLGPTTGAQATTPASSIVH